MKLLNRTLVLALLLTLPLSAADPLYGIKLTTDIDFGSGAGGMSTTYVTKLDGAEVPVYSAGKVVMRLRGKRTGPNTYEAP